MGRKTETLAAGAETTMSLGGNYLVVEKSGQPLEIELIHPDKTPEQHFVKQGSTLYKKDFKSIEVRNIGTASTSVEIWTGVGSYSASQGDVSVKIDGTAGAVPTNVQSIPAIEIDDTVPVSTSTVITNAAGSPVPVTLQSGSVTLNQSNISNGATSVPDASIAATSTAKVVTAAATNLRVRITNLSTTETMRVGCHNQVGASNGTPLAPGDTWENFTEAGVWVYNPGAAAESVAIEVETRI